MLSSIRGDHNSISDSFAFDNESLAIKVARCADYGNSGALPDFVLESKIIVDLFRGHTFHLNV